MSPLEKKVFILGKKNIRQFEYEGNSNNGGICYGSIIIKHKNNK